MLGPALTLVCVVALWALLTVEGWGREAPAPGPSGRVLTLAWARPVELDGADPRPIVTCVQRWPDLEDPAPCRCCGRPTVAVVVAGVVRCRGPPLSPGACRTYARRLSCPRSHPSTSSRRAPTGHQPPSGRVPGVASTRPDAGRVC